MLGYVELQKKMAETGTPRPDARQIFDWVCAIRRAKLPDPTLLGNAGSFFNVPGRHARAVPRHHRPRPGDRPLPMPDGSVKLAAACDDRCLRWKGKSVGQAGVYERQALVLVNRGAAIGWR